MAGLCRWLYCLSLLQAALGYVKLGKHIVKYSEEKLKYVLDKGDHPSMLLEIFSPTCPACEAFAPRMSRAAERIKQEAPDIKVVAVDGTEADSIMRDFGTQEFPSVFFLGSDRKKARLDFKEADSADAIVSWTLRVSAPTIRNLSSLSELPQFDEKRLPQLILHSPRMVPAFASLAQEHLMAFESFWIQEDVQPVSQVRHSGQDPQIFTWANPNADSLDDDGELFEEFLKENVLPAVILVSDVKQTTKLLDGLPHDAQFLWLVLNSSSQDSACGSAERSCSASSGDGLQPLQQALDAHKQLLQDGLRLARETSKKTKNIYGLCVDIAKWPGWIEKELYAWSAPILVGQRFRHGPRYFFAEDSLPASAQELNKWFQSLVTRTPRQMSERPPSARPGKLWRKAVNLGLEEQLRAEPATLLYIFKSPDSFSQEQEVIDYEDEMEALDALAEWLKTNCERPPPLAALDVRKNEVPLSLYAAASIGSLNAPNLFLIESDANKQSMGVRWAGEISEYADRSMHTEVGQRQQALLSRNLPDSIRWTLAKARPVPALKLPEKDPDLSSLGTSTPNPVQDIDSEAALQSFLRRNLTGFVEFFAPSCGACKKFAPIYESAARKAQATNNAYAFARIDCSTNAGEQSCNAHGVDAYPSVFYVHRGKMEKYAGGSKRHELLNYLTTMTESLVENVASEEEAWKLANSRKRPVLLWQGEESANYSAVETAAADWRQRLKLVKVSGERHEGASLMLLWPGSAKQSVLYEPDADEPYSADSLAIWLAEQFVKSEPKPSVQGTVKTVVGASFREMVFDPLERGQHVMLEVYAPWCGHCRKLAPEYEKFAQKMLQEGREIVVAKLNGDANGIPYGGFEYKGFPTIFYLAPGAQDIRKVDERTAEGLINFVRQQRVPGKRQTPSEEDSAEQSMDKLLNQFQSEDVPAKQTFPVLTVVLKNFVQTVFSDTRSCILMLYAKGCPHCQQMMPEFDGFAKKIAHREDLFLAKMDGQANDLPINGFGVKGFPTLFFIEAGQKEPAETFIGNNALIQVQQFLESRGLLSEKPARSEL